MTDDAALLASIFAAPSDDTPRLVYADWLDDHGHDTITAFIRAEVAKAQTGLTACPSHKGHLWRSPTWGCGTCDFCRLEIECERYHEDGLLWDAVSGLKGVEILGGYAHTSRHPSRFTNESPSPFTTLFTARGFVGELHCTMATFAGGECERCRGSRAIPNPDDSCRVCGNRPDEDGAIEHGRGCYTQSEDGGGTSYADEIPCPACSGPGRTPGLAKSIFERHPITAVRFTDRTPRLVSDSLSHGWTWSRESPHPEALGSALPDAIRDRLPMKNRQSLVRDFKRWDTAQWAIEAASTAAVAYGRSLAGITDPATQPL